MVIDNAAFTFDGNIRAIINGVEFFVPDDPDNAERKLLSEWVKQGNTITPYVEPDRPDAVTEVPSVTLWERLTNDEADQVNSAMATQPFRIRQIFLTANTFRSDHELWPLLVQMATDLFGEDRAADLLSQI